MKVTAQILLFVFISFLITPNAVSAIQKNADISVFYSFSEEEKAQKEIKATRWVQLNYLCFNVVYWSFKNKFIDELYQS